MLTIVDVQGRHRNVHGLDFQKKAREHVETTGFVSTATSGPATSKFLRSRHARFLGLAIAFEQSVDLTRHAE